MATNKSLNFQPNTSSTSRTQRIYKEKSKLLVTGYCRIDLNRYIPKTIVELIIYFYIRKYCIYGVGKNSFGEFSVGSCRKLEKFELLQEFSYLCDDLHDIYV